MSGYIYIIENEKNVPNSISIRETTLPIEEAMQGVASWVKCTHVWACDWPHRLAEAIQDEYEQEISPVREDYYKKDILTSLHLFIDSYLEDNFSSETKDLLQSTKDKRPTRADMSPGERRLDEIQRAEEATIERRDREGIPNSPFVRKMKGLD